MNKSTKIKYGDIIKLGPHLLVCGDSRDKKLVKKLIGKQKIDLVETDVPYGVGLIESKKGFAKLSHRKAIKNDQPQTDEEYSQFTYDWLSITTPYLNRKNSIYIFNSDKMLFALRDGMLRAGCKFSQLLIWVKNQPVIGRMDYLIQHELLALGWFGVHKFCKSQDKSLLFYPKPRKSKYHSTTKPLGLIRRIILNASDIGDVVYDPFLGSGTTLLACEQTKRKCIGIELVPEYCQTVVDRYNKLTK